jgi:hypothetical protein
MLLIVVGWAIVCAGLLIIDGGIRSPLLPFVLGILVGLVATNVAVIRSSVRNWSVLKSVIDWQRVEELAREADADTA